MFMFMLRRDRIGITAVELFDLLIYSDLRNKIRKGCRLLGSCLVYVQEIQH